MARRKSRKQAKASEARVALLLLPAAILLTGAAMLVGLTGSSAHVNKAITSITQEL